ncbi:MAG: peptidase [Verrucomicrobiales bacterium]|nr:peptidase [Verrucomicrobiales bacterium]
MTTPTRAIAMPRLTSQQTVQLLILGLPTGLIITGVIAMFIYFRVDKVREDREARILTAKPLNAADLQSGVHTLAAAIGPRHSAVPETINSAKKYIQSTLGPANLGYRVSRVEFQKDGQLWHHLVIDLAGKSAQLRNEVVVVAANYDSATDSPGADANASGTAALMALAHAFAGSSQERTLRFVATVRDAPPFAGTEEMGSLNYATTLREEGGDEKVAAVVTLEGLGCYSDAPGSQKIPPTPSAAYPDKGNFLAVVANPAAQSMITDGFRARLIQSTDLPLEIENSPAAGPLLGQGTAWAFDRAGLPVIRITDTGELRNPQWQHAGDKPETLDYPKFLQAVKAAESVIMTLLNPRR